ncbi:hypothetical protein BV25DRAFT_548788 [Artomyces pyxidatus]|uniref:Uncharacterized protein n=1 Tax=Artomyces pyxidatus TaxID=48021 RepID=A0ACB8TIK0_9AGAM|nr:hypothetical protein BV25DRAFT_548788 [Artomyces pyxidatus]
MSQESVLLAPSPPPAIHQSRLQPPQDIWSDVQEAFEDDAAAHEIEEVENRESEDITLKAQNFASAGVDKTTDVPVLDTTLDGPSPPPDSPTGRTYDSVSMQSLPTVQVTEPQSPGPQPQSANLASFSGSSLDDVSGSTGRSVWSTAGTAAPPSLGRRSRPRSAVDSRSPNRLSGFFSNLIHRREPSMLPPSPSVSTPRDRGTSPTPEDSTVPSRASSPVPPPRAGTPPPSLPPPTLQELGLSLSVLTNNLSPSHFSTPPASGAFLAPHYLLLCHAQGLDVLPLVSPPAPQPYALIRRVSFKSVVVMEHRGVLVAIAGRRDGVRVYALEEVKKAVEWRLEVEVRRERERARREEAKKSLMIRDSPTIDMLALETYAPLSASGKAKPIRRSPSAGAAYSPPPRNPVPKRSKTPPQTPPQPPHLPPALAQVPSGPPPSYRSPSPPRRLISQQSTISLNQARARSSSVSDVLSGTISRRVTDAAIVGRERESERSGDSKTDWLEAHESSDDEAINVVAAGASGSEALDERTSAMAAAASPNILPRIETSPLSPRSPRPLSTATMTSPATRRPRPADLDLSVTRTMSNSRTVVAPPSPTPTLVTLRQALASSPPSGSVPTLASLDSRLPVPPTPDADADGTEDEHGETTTPTNERVSFAQMLQESRLPELPPPGTRREQQAILITESHPVATGEEDVPSSPVSSNAPSHRTRQSQETQVSRRSRRRWSVLEGIFTAGSGPGSSNLPSQPEHPPLPPLPDIPSSASQLPQMRERRTAPISRTASSTFQNPPASQPPEPRSTRPPPPQSQPPSERATQQPAPSHSRFLSRIIGSAFARRSEDHPEALQQRVEQVDGGRRGMPGTPAPHTPAPKLEYVKLPGTKNSLMIKAVETSKKSFLAILCGESGEKVELFAGTYRTALGLSRTFILPDSPRSLELQLQGDDLVEVFLVFSQNVFGLEPATVRVREVRLGRAERRAARRRARELQTEDAQQSGAELDAIPPTEETTRVNVSVGLAPATSPPVTPDAAATGPGAATSTSQVTTGRVSVGDSPSLAPKPDDVMVVATAQMGPYTTFQQLSFSPLFPLASIADDYVIPPTYRDFLQYRTEHEPDVTGNGDVDLSQVQFSPPGLPLPPSAPPSKWFYRDPKGVIHGPWKSSLMQAWYRDGLLPPDLPVRREEDADYVLLRDLRQQCVDPTQPFGTSPPRPLPGEVAPIPQGTGKPLLSPISLLTQSRIFGPPALFFSSRGGHSTAIVDGRGRSVLKDRFLWSQDDADDNTFVSGRLGDVKRLEAFDVQDRSVLVAMRQGGFEAVDLGDALLRPADSSRSVLPHFTTTAAQVNRRGPYTWRIGMPVSTPSSGLTALLPLKSHSHRLTTPAKKLSTGPGKSPARMEFSGGEVDSEHTRDEVIFLGRKDDSVYICERNGGAFRILRLCPVGSS